ncbi:MAG: hydroxymethylglutaryl-CoA reductase, degradative [Thermoplasmatota archaeon]
MTWSGFHRLPHAERLAKIQAHGGLSDAEAATLAAASSLPREMAEAFVENAVGTFPLPLGFAVGFVVDGADVAVPMAVEESSVIAAACHGAKLVAAGGGFTTEVDAPVMIGQVEIRDADPDVDVDLVLGQHRDAWVAAGDALMPGMVGRGGGMRDIRIRSLAEGHLVAHLHIDCRDAMGANLVNTVAEALAADMAEAFGGVPGLRILSNLATERMATARCRVPVDVLGGVDVAQAMVAANDFARLDPYRGATHNKGIMNGIDPVVIATGNDWRAVEAGAHAWAAQDGQYRGLTRYAIEGGHLVGELTLPMSLGTVGGVTALHPVAKACLKVLGSPGAQGLARIVVAVGLAQNLSALKALATEGIQKGHMRLHEANKALRNQGP